MKLDLADLVAPRHTAVVTQELQGAVVGPGAGLRELADEARRHGLGPMGGTELDAVLRNLGASTIIAVGVSANIAITNLVMDAVNAGYRVVLPRDAVAGIPTEYADAVIDNTLSLLATVTTTGDVLRAWQH